MSGARREEAEVSSVNSQTWMRHEEYVANEQRLLVLYLPQGGPAHRLPGVCIVVLRAFTFRRAGLALTSWLDTHMMPE